MTITGLEEAKKVRRENKAAGINAQNRGRIQTSMRAAINANCFYCFSESEEGENILSARKILNAGERYPLL